MELFHSFLWLSNTPLYIYTCGPFRACGPAARVAHGSLLEMQSLRPHPRPSIMSGIVSPQKACPPSTSGGDFPLSLARFLFLQKLFSCYYLERGSLHIILTKGSRDEIIHPGVLRREGEDTQIHAEGRRPWEVGGRV